VWVTQIFYDFSWQDGSGIRLHSGTNVRMEGTKLVIDNAQPQQSGNYTCVAENMAAQRSVTFQLVVTGK